MKIHARYGKETVRLIKENPYRLCSEVFGIGFKTADRIARELGVGESSAYRIEAALSHLLELATAEGHLCLPRQELISRVSEVIEADRSLLDDRISKMCGRGVLFEEEGRIPSISEGKSETLPMIFLSPFRDAEINVFKRLEAIETFQGSNVSINGPAALDWAEKGSGLDLDTSQRDAVLAALGEPVLIITGGPGVGKTTIIRLIARIFNRKGVRIMLAAPTGRAAKRLSEAAGFPASTIHRMLKFRPRKYSFEHNRSNPLPCDMLVVDECSMIDVPIAEKLLMAVPDGARLLLVGDSDQLPSVGPGDFLRALIESKRFPVKRLTKLFRQKEEGGIITAAHAVNAGRYPRFTPGGAEGEVFFVEQPDAEKAARMVVRLVSERIPKRFGLDPVRDVQVITPMHKGAVGTERLNAGLRDVLNPGRSGPTGRGGAPAGPGPFREGDKVMQIRNNYELEVFNGDIGFAESIDKEEGTMTVLMQGRAVEYDSGQAGELVHAYCVSIHKSQGCEFPAVVMPLLTQHFLLLKRNLVYTGITRARKLLVIVGSPRALRIAVANDTVSERYSLLRSRLAGEGVGA